MAHQAKRAPSGAHESGEDHGHGGTASTNMLAEVTRQQMAMGAEVLSTFFRAAGAVRQAQVQMGERAALLHRQAAENLRKADTPGELMSIQSTLMVYQWQEVMRYWQELGTAAAKAGNQAMHPSQAQQDGTVPSAAAATMMGAAMNAAAAPMADALQQMFAAPMKATHPH